MFVFEFQPGISRGSLLSYFWGILLIFALITILEDVGSLLPARTVTVKIDFRFIFRQKNASKINFSIFDRIEFVEYYVTGSW